MAKELQPGLWVTQMPCDGITWRDASDSCFQIFGLHMPSVYRTDGKPAVYERLPEEVALHSYKDIATLRLDTAGARLRFKTDSEYVAIRCHWGLNTDSITPAAGVLQTTDEIPHMPATGACGFDLYLTKNGDCRYFKSFVPPNKEDRVNGYQSIVHFGSAELRDVTIHFPLYHSVDILEIGLESYAKILPSEPYRLNSPIVYYGSSITQGGCASRPGNSYEAFISRALNLDQRNLGFSDSARGDIAVAEYIASLDMCAFVYDYDHNAPTPEWLANTHEPFYQIIRRAHPDIPIICVTKPKPMPLHVAVPGRVEAPFTDIPPDEFVNMDNARKQIVKDTVLRAQQAGDTNIRFIDGDTLFAGDFSDCCTVDGSHPNDLGFYRMAQAFIPVLSKMLHFSP